MNSKKENYRDEIAKAKVEMLAKALELISKIDVKTFSRSAGWMAVDIAREALAAKEKP